MMGNHTYRFFLIVAIVLTMTCLSHATTSFDHSIPDCSHNLSSFAHSLSSFAQALSADTVKTKEQEQHQEEAKKAKKQRMVYLQGTSKDSFTKAMLQAHITVMDADSAVIDTTTAWRWDNEGGWYMQVPARAGMLIIKGECDGYETSFLNFNIRSIGRNSSFKVPPVLLKKKLNEDIYKDVDLDGVVVTGTKIKMTYRGDTIVYNASAFNLPDGSMLDALIRQMPGAELKSNGDIYINGKKLDYLLLNGKDFFKGKNKVMLDNLPYYTVKELKVYNKQTDKSEMLGENVEKKDYVMDVSLKRQYNRGLMANAEVAGGTKERWMARLFSLYFDDHTRLSLFANANNVNETQTPGTEGDWQPSNSPQGQTTTRLVGLHLDTEDENKVVTDNIDATATWTDAVDEVRSASESFASGGNIFRRSMSLNRQKDFRASLQNNMRLRTGNIGMTSWTSLDYSNSRNNANSRKATYDNDPSRFGSIKEVLDSTFFADTNPLLSMLTNRSQSISLDRYRSFSASQDTWAFYKLPWGDRLEININGTYSLSKPSDSHTMTRNDYMKTGESDTRNVYSDHHNNNYSYNAALSYSLTLPVGLYIKLQGGYKQSLSTSNNLNYRLDRFGGRWTDLATSMLHELPSTRDSMLLALDFDNSIHHADLKRSYTTQAVLNFNNRSNTLFASMLLPLRWQHERLSYQQAVLDTVATRRNVLFMPGISVFCNKEKVQYSAALFLSSTLPPMTSLMPVSNDLNPLAVRISNPGLKRTDNMSFNGDISFNQKRHQQNISFGFDANISRNSLGTRTTYNRATGGYTYMSDNVKDGNWSVNARNGFTRTLDKADRLTIDNRLSYNYSRSTDFDIAYDEESTALSRVNTSLLGEKLLLIYRKGNFSASCSGNLSWRHSTGDRDNFETINTFDFSYGMTLSCRLPLSVTLATDLRQYSRRGYGESSINTDNLVWNASLTRTFGKGKWVLKAEAFDLLHQLSNTTYAVNAQGRTEVWRNTIPSYAMLHLAYKWSKMPKGKK